MSYIKLYRQIQDHEFLNKGSACNFRAWVDLLMLASYNEHKIVINKKPFMLSRGDLAASVRFLRKRWKWGTSKTLGFLAVLETLEMMVKKQNGSGNGSPSIYHIVNYDIYQHDDYKSSTVPGTLPERFQNASRTKLRRDKKGKEGKRAADKRRTFSDLHIGKPQNSSGVQEEFDEEAVQRSLDLDLEQMEADLRSKPNLSKEEKRWLHDRERKKFCQA